MTAPWNTTGRLIRPVLAPPAGLGQRLGAMPYCHDPTTASGLHAGEESFPHRFRQLYLSISYTSALSLVPMMLLWGDKPGALTHYSAPTALQAVQFANKP